MIDFTNIEYLKTGNPIQQKAYKAITEIGIMEKLEEFAPLLAGTIPININIENSDLDIICKWENKNGFKEKLEALFDNLPDFELREKFNRNYETVIASFTKDGFMFEIFGQNRPSEIQEAFRHMLIEYEILKQKGDIFRQQIIKLKKQGIKTEPAFAELLGLKGNPYDELLKIEV